MLFKQILKINEKKDEMKQKIIELSEKKDLFISSPIEILLLLNSFFILFFSKRFISDYQYIKGLFMEEYMINIDHFFKNKEAAFQLLDAELTNELYQLVSNFQETMIVISLISIGFIVRILYSTLFHSEKIKDLKIIYLVFLVGSGLSLLAYPMSIFNDITYNPFYGEILSLEQLDKAIFLYEISGDYFGAYFSHYFIGYCLSISISIKLIHSFIKGRQLSVKNGNKNIELEKKNTIDTINNLKKEENELITKIKENTFELNSAFDYLIVKEKENKELTKPETVLKKLLINIVQDKHKGCSMLEEHKRLLSVENKLIKKTIDNS